MSWAPVQVALEDHTLWVANNRGQGIGPTNDPTFTGPLRHGTVSSFPVPPPEELPVHTATVMEANGFRPRPDTPVQPPAQVRYVVLIQKEDRSFDEIFGDIAEVSNGPVMGMPELARFGSRGYITGNRERLSVQDLNVTPNHHAMAARWAFSDNFYADIPGWPDSGLWRHLERNRVSCRIYREPGELSDQRRADAFIADLRARYVQGKEEFPRVLYIHLPNDRMGAPRPREGYPYEGSWVADNDYALGRIVEFLSGTRWWREMAVFVTEDEVLGHDHIDAHRTILLALGPWARRNYVSHVNTGFAGLLKTIFRLLSLPPLGLADAAASDLVDCFALQPSFEPYTVLPEDPRILQIR